MIPNKLLRALPPHEYERLLPKLEEVDLKFNQIIYARGDSIRYVYFPNSGIVSLLAVVDGGATVDVGMVGRDGMVGLSRFMGVKTSLGSAIVLGDGTAMRMASADFDKQSGNGGVLPRVLLRFVRSMMVQISQSAACNRFHTVEQRLARWLLMTSDRMMSDEFRITQTFLSSMLGVRRESVTLAAGMLRTAGLIRYFRGHIVIIDRSTLESTACSCYTVIRDEEQTFPVPV